MPAAPTTSTNKMLGRNHEGDLERKRPALTPRDDVDESLARRRRGRSLRGLDPQAARHRRLGARGDVVPVALLIAR